MVDAQKTFVCDKLHTAEFPDQKNDPALFSRGGGVCGEGTPDEPVCADVRGAGLPFCGVLCGVLQVRGGRSHPEAAARAAAAAKVHFNLETKVLPERPAAGGQEAGIPAEMFDNHTVSPQVFVETLCGAIKRSGMEARADVQSFDFRTLVLVEEQFPRIQTVYLTEGPKLLSSSFVPVGLRLDVAR